MRQIEAFELQFIIQYELARIGKSTLRDMASGHQDTKRRGVKIATDRLLARMEKWEIIVPEASGNIFASARVSRDASPKMKTVPLKSARSPSCSACHGRRAALFRHFPGSGTRNAKWDRPRSHFPGPSTHRLSPHHRLEVS